MTIASAGITPTYNSSSSPLQCATWNFTGDTSGAAVVNLGFTPVFVKVWDMTAATSYEWIQGMAATDSIKVVTAGTTTVDTNSAVVTNGTVVSTTTTGVYAPATSEAGAGTIINTTVNVFGTLLTTAQLTLGSVCNVSTHLMVGMAIGG